ncbi:MAG: peptidoglycan DD-metalloendopeptidase family protein [Alistipes sp.]|nr:peptidoglycan DD-metalloendopeptidase family protein [Alistipes sp.]
MSDWRYTVRLLTATAAMLLLSAAATGASAQSKSAVEKQRAKVESYKRDLEQCKRRMKEIIASKSSASRQIEQLRTQMNLRNNLIHETEEEMRLLQQQIDNSDSVATVLGAEIERNRAIYAEMVREAWRNYRQNNYTTYLFSARGVSDAARRTANIRRIAEMRAQKADEIASQEQELGEYRAELNRRKHELDSVSLSLASERNALRQDISDVRSRLNKLSANEKKTLSEQNSYQKRLDAAAEELRRLTKGNTEGASFTDKTSNLNLPVEGGSVMRYSNNVAYVKGRKGAKVVSIYDGKVVKIDRDNTNRFSVFVAHGGYISTYVHLGSVCVAEGDKIKKNQQIGTVGIGIDDEGRESIYMNFALYNPSGKKLNAANCFKK